MHLKRLVLTYSAYGPFTKKEFKNLKKQEIQNIFAETNSIKLVLDMMWFIENFNI